MAIEQFGIDARLDLAVLLRVQVLLITGLVGAALRIDFAGEQQVLAVGGEQHPIGFGGKIGGLPGVAPIRIHQPDLGRSAAVGDIRDPLGIGRPARALVGFAVMCDLARRAAGGARWARRDPDLRRLLVGSHVHRLHGERHPFAVGRDLRIAHPLQLHHGGGIERLLLRENDRHRSQRENEPAAHT